MSDKPNLPEDIESAQNGQVNETRRRLTKAGLGASAVVATLASRPVFADACTISGMASGNASPAPGQKPCGGCTPGYWRNHPRNWPSPYLPGTCKECQTNSNKCKEWNNDGTTFPFALGTNDPRYGKTMMQVLEMTGNQDPYQLGAHAIAALLNSIALKNTSYSFGYSDVQIFELWTQYASSEPEKLKNMYAQLNERMCPLGQDEPPDQCN